MKANRNKNFTGHLLLNKAHTATTFHNRKIKNVLILVVIIHKRHGCVHVLQTHEREKTLTRTRTFKNETSKEGKSNPPSHVGKKKRKQEKEENKTNNSSLFPHIFLCVKETIITKII